MPRPNMVFCYICGREFSSASIGIHEPQCLKKWHRENELLPKNQQRPPPVKPNAASPSSENIVSGSKGPTKEDMGAYNEAAIKAANANLVPCKKCGRTFNPDRIDVHTRACKPTNLPKKVMDYPSLDAKAYLADLGSATSRLKEGPSPSASKSANDGLVPCNNCGRTFNPDRLPVHERGCKTKVNKSKNNSDLNADFNEGDTSLSLTSNNNCDVITNQSSLIKKTNNVINNSPNTTLRPRTIVCYICGREFGSKSINIHEPQCLHKWELENAQLPKHQRRKPPTKPSALEGESTTLLERNEVALKSYYEQNLLPCPHCGRRFATDRLDVHLRSCKPKDGASKIDKRSVSNMRPEPMKPRLLTCYICGREYGSKSLPIHEPKCLDAWHLENDKLSKSQRRKCPVKPSEKANLLGERQETYSLIEYNEAAWQASQENLAPCPNCARTFKPDRLAVHLRSCRPK